MIKQFKLNDKIVSYNMQYKNVKNINLRIKSDGSINVSASCFVSQQKIDEFLKSKSNLIIKSLDEISQSKNKVKICYVPAENIQSVITEFCWKFYPYFKRKGIEFPKIKFRSMVSQWGNCRAQKGILTFNTNLMYAPVECIEYVIVHEFTHFLQPNHSNLFYNELEKIMPDWRARRKKLKEIIL